MGVIYKITSPTGRVYVGKTKRPKTRVWEYRWRSKKRKSIVHDSIKGYGWEAHKFEIIEECDDLLLNEREIFWIKELNTFYLDNPMGMNMTRGGDGGGQSWMHDIERRKKQSERFSGKNGTFYGRKHSDETKKTLSEKAKIRNKITGQKVPYWGAEIGRQKVMRAILCYNKMGDFVGEYESAADASRKIKILRGSIVDSLLYNSWCNGQYLFKYKTENYPLKIEVGKINVRVEKRAVYWLSEDLEPICEFPSAKEASDFLGIPKTTINRAAMYNDLQPIRTGHIFFYKDLYLEEYKLVS